MFITSQFFLPYPSDLFDSESLVHRELAIAIILVHMAKSFSNLCLAWAPATVTQFKKKGYPHVLLMYSSVFVANFLFLKTRFHVPQANLKPTMRQSGMVLLLGL